MHPRIYNLISGLALKSDLSTETLVKVAKENNLGTISPISAKNLAVEPSIERIKNIKNVEVSRVQSVKCIVRLPEPKNMNSPKSDSNKSNPSRRKRKQRNSKKIDEMGPKTPITRFFDKKT